MDKKSAKQIIITNLSMIKCAKMLRKNLGDDQKLVGKQVIKFWKRLKKYLFLTLFSVVQNLVYSHVPPNQMANKQFCFQILTEAQGLKKMTRSVESSLDFAPRQHTGIQSDFDPHVFS